MNRFEKDSFFSGIRGKLKLLSLLFFATLFIIFIVAVNNVSADSVERQQASLETALQRDISHCYAVEGTYPPSLQYMKDHFGLTYDESLFFVDYQPIGSNLRPDVTVIRIAK